MTPFERANTYLVIPPTFRVHFGGLRWSPTHDCILDAAGDTFALAEEIAAVLEGVFARPPVPPFAYVLVVLLRMKRGLDDLAVAYGLAKPTNAGNVGRLIAELCRDMPIAMNPPTAEDMRSSLDDWHRTFHAATLVTIAEGTIAPETIERLLDGVLDKHTPESLAAWLKYGGPTPTAAGGQLAAPVEDLSVRLGKLLAVAQARPRLAGAAWLTPALDAALTFPPRRPKANAVPQGGYADVTTRGHPERLLLSQFALDTDEFVRRFAERELLYFRPEEPHVPPPPDRVLVLDQGVRTWGGVRLALAGCALTLLTKQGKKAGRVDLVHTAAGVVDLATATTDELAEALEASDLTATPAAAIRTAFALPADGPRDVILLTHPRTLADPPVIAALNGCGETDRAFVVSVDEIGRAEVHEWGVRGPVRVRAFRVDLPAAERAGAKKQPVSAATDFTTWTGDIEPIGFPFRPGVVAEPTLFGFDGASEWLVAASRDGTLHALGVDDGRPPEVLPRAFRNGAVLKQVDAVLGTADGVVVCGRMTLPDPPAYTVTTSATVTLGGSSPVMLSSATEPIDEPAEWNVAAHYDRGRRRVTLHTLTPVGRSVRWCVSTTRDAVGVRPIPMRPGDVTTDVNLATGERTERPRLTDWTSRTEAPPYKLPIWTEQSTEESFRCQPYLYLEDEGFEVRLVEPAWPRSAPMREGKPLLGEGYTENAVLANGVLAVGRFDAGERHTLVFRGPDTRLVYQLPRDEPGAPTALSPDGHLLALRSRLSDISLVETTSSALPRRIAATARLHNSLMMELQADPFALFLGVGEFLHTFRLVEGRLKHDFRRESKARWVQTAAPRIVYDPARFPVKQQVASGRWTAAFDRLGQVVLLRDDTPVAAFLIRRERAAAFARGGVFWGDPLLLGRPQVVNADRAFVKQVCGDDSL